MLEKLLARLEAFLQGAFVPKAELEVVNIKLTEATEHTTWLESQLSLANQNVEGQSNLISENLKQISALTSERDALSAEVSKLKAEATTLDAAAATKAREICAAQGIPAGKLPNEETNKPNSQDAELEQTRAAMAKETDPKKRATLARKCRELRGHSQLLSEPTKP